MLCGPWLDTVHALAALQGEHVAGVAHRRHVGMRHCLELGEVGLHSAHVSEADEGSLVAHLVAVVWSAV